MIYKTNKIVISVKVINNQQNNKTTLFKICNNKLKN